MVRTGKGPGTQTVENAQADDSLHSAGQDPAPQTLPITDLQAKLGFYPNPNKSIPPEGERTQTS